MALATVLSLVTCKPMPMLRSLASIGFTSDLRFAQTRCGRRGASASPGISSPSSCRRRPRLQLPQLPGSHPSDVWKPARPNQLCARLLLPPGTRLLHWPQTAFCRPCRRCVGHRETSSKKCVCCCPKTSNRHPLPPLCPATVATPSLLPCAT